MTANFKRIHGLSMVMGISFLLAAGLRGADETPGGAPTEAPAAIEAKGLLKPLREVRLASRSQGVIREIKEEGTVIKEGEAVVLLEDARERLEVQKQQQVLEMRKFEGEAGKRLDSGGAISRLEGMEKAINLEVAKLLVAEAMELLDRRRVVAPFDGVVTERMREVGEAVDEFVPVLTMVDLDKLYFEMYLPAEHIRAVAEGQPAEVMVETFPEKVFPGTVKLIAPVVNAASSEFKVRVVIDNPDRTLRSGLPGTCRLLPQAPAASAATTP